MANNSGKDEFIVALDIGTTKVLCLVADYDDEGQLRIVGVGQENCQGLNKGVISEIDATVKHSLAVGAQGKVYMDIKAGGTGQVQVEFQNAMRTCDAVLEDETSSLKTGKFVEVVKAIGETLIVKPLSVSSVMAEEE